MRRTAPWLMAMAMWWTTGCGGEAPPPAPPEDGPPWEPFVHGEVSDGIEGVARFQIAPCAYAEMVERLPTCALELPLVDGHRTSLHVLLPEGMVGALDVSDASVLRIDDARPTARDDIQRLDISALTPGDVALRVRADGAVIDSVTVRVRRAVSVEIRADGAHATAPLSLHIGSELRLRATALDADGAPLNAWSEIDWAVTSGLRTVDQRGAELRLTAEQAGDARIDSFVGEAHGELAVVVE